MPDLSPGRPRESAPEDVDVAVAASGAAAVAWSYGTDAGGPLVALRDRPGRFGAGQRIRGADGLFPRVAIAADGEAAIAFRRAGLDEIALATRPPRGSFSDTAVLQAGRTDGRLRALAFDGARALWMWVSYETAGEGLLVRRADGSLSEHPLPPGAIAPDDALGRPLGLDASGALTFMRELPGNVLAIQRRDSAGVLGPHQRLGRYACNQDDEAPYCNLSAEVAVAPSGDALAVWSSAPALRLAPRVRVAQRRGNGSFGAARTVGPAGAVDPRAEMGQRGDGLVTWRQGRRGSVLYALLADRRGRLHRPRRLGMPREGERTATVSSRGHAIVLWEQPRGQLRAVVRRPGRGFAASRVIARDAAGILAWDVGIDASGRAVVAYVGGRAAGRFALRALEYRP